MWVDQLNWAYSNWPECAPCAIGRHDQCDRWQHGLNCSCYNRNCRARWDMVGVL